MTKLSASQKHVLHDWWTWLQPESQNDPAIKARLAGQFGGFARAHRATLKRCAEPSLVLLEPAFHSLLHRLEQATTENDYVQPDAWNFALVAGLLAWVDSEPPKDIQNRSFAAQLGRPKAEGSDRPLMSKLRFARLQTADSAEDFFQQARQAIQLAGKTADVVHLTEELLDWQKEFQGQKPDKPRDRIQVRWASAYYSAALKPETTIEPSSKNTGA
ncbi:MAG: type I-E CRISPR-associated protein Cse2/CasB [Rhodocyclaceae bacterium]|nr:type I-E CRISPR-associated protein Cse2/CasB [Rhodocyclaceae bacterium]